MTLLFGFEAPRAAKSSPFDPSDISLSLLAFISRSPSLSSMGFREIPWTRQERMRGRRSGNRLTEEFSFHPPGSFWLWCPFFCENFFPMLCYPLTGSMLTESPFLVGLSSELTRFTRELSTRRETCCHLTSPHLPSTLCALSSRPSPSCLLCTNSVPLETASGSTEVKPSFNPLTSLLNKNSGSGTHRWNCAFHGYKTHKRAHMPHQRVIGECFRASSWGSLASCSPEPSGLR